MSTFTQVHPKTLMFLLSLSTIGLIRMFEIDARLSGTIYVRFKDG